MKANFLLLVLFLFQSGLTIAQSIGPNSPSSSSLSGTGANFPSLPGIYVPADNNVAYTDLTDYPLCVNQFSCFYSKKAVIAGFQFNIPSNATITGILVRLRKMISNPLPNIKDSLVQLIKYGAPIGLNLANNLQWPNSLTYVNYGDSTNLWGATWTPADINNVDFGLSLIVKNTDFSQLAQYDHATITVYYTIPNSIQNIKTAADIKLSINPEFISLLNSAEFQGISIQLYNMLGEKVKSISNFQGDAIPVSDLRKGIYIMQIATSKGLFSKRITLN